MSSRLRNHRGITLAEVLIAMAILTIALVPVLIGFQSSSNLSKDSTEVMQATNLARMELENIKNKAYTDAVSISRRNFSTIEDPTQRYDYQIVVNQYPSASSSPSYKQVEVRVFLRGQTSPTVKLLTYITEGGV